MKDFIMQPWPWWWSGICISAIMFFLIFFGKTFGFSSNLATICAAAGFGKKIKIFDFNWKNQIWNVVFLVGAIIGGFIAKQFLSTSEPIRISPSTISDLEKLGFTAPVSIQPTELFGVGAIYSLKGFLILATAGLMVGFGTRYAGGCTSGHGISGLSNLQSPSLIAVIGFFIGGLAMTFLIFPLIFNP